MPTIAPKRVYFVLTSITILLVNLHRELLTRVYTRVLINRARAPDSAHIDGDFPCAVRDRLLVLPAQNVYDDT